MDRWIRPLVVAATLAVLFAACSLGTEGASTTLESTTTTVVETTTSTAAPTTTTALPVVLPTQPGTFFVSDYGAVADGKNDDSAAFQSAVDAAAVEGGVVVVPSVAGRRAYVLNSTVTVKTGVSLIGAVVGTGLDVGGPYPWPETDITGAKIFARPSPVTQPMFRLEAGTSVQGLWITYDQQPLPSDRDISRESGDFQYRSFCDARDFFIEEHVAPAGPTFYIESGDQVLISNIVADRYYDFLHMKSGGPLRVDGVALYGYQRGFVVESSDAVNVFTNITFGPTVGPFVPGPSGTETWTWAFGALASNLDNVGFHFGRSDGFVLDNVSFHGGNTAIRLGATFDYPIIDPTNQDFVVSDPGNGPWGQIEDLRIDNAAVGFHLIAPSVQPLQLTNVSMTSGIDDGGSFPAESGTGDMSGVSRQALILAEPSYNADANGVPSQVPAILAANVSMSGRADVDRFGEAAGAPDAINGRVFLVNGDIGMEINGFALGLPYDDTLMIASGGSAETVSVRMRGVLNAGQPESDKVADIDGVTTLAGDIVVVEVPVTVTVVVPPSTMAPPDTTTTTAAP